MRKNLGVQAKQHLLKPNLGRAFVLIWQTETSLRAACPEGLALQLGRGRLHAKSWVRLDPAGLEIAESLEPQWPSAIGTKASLHNSSRQTVETSNYGESWLIQQIFLSRFYGLDPVLGPEFTWMKGAYSPLLR